MPRLVIHPAARRAAPWKCSCRRSSLTRMKRSGGLTTRSRVTCGRVGCVGPDGLLVLAWQPAGQALCSWPLAGCSQRLARSPHSTHLQAGHPRWRARGLRPSFSVPFSG